MSDRALIVFVKHPAPGQVKTRLVPVLGEDLATELYRALGETILEATVPGAGEYERLVFFAPEGAVEGMRAWLPGLRLIPQAGADLGERMAAAFARAFWPAKEMTTSSPGSAQPQMVTGRSRCKTM